MCHRSALRFCTTKFQWLHTLSCCQPHSILTSLHLFSQKRRMKVHARHVRTGLSRYAIPGSPFTSLPVEGRRLGFSRAAMVPTQHPALVPTTERQLPSITTTTMITHAAVSRETAPDRVRLHDSPGARERRERTAPAPPKKAPRWPQPVSARRWTRGAILS